MKEAVFSLIGYNFPEVKLDMSSVADSNGKFNLSIIPSGVFDQTSKTFALNFKFSASVNSINCIDVTCVAGFSFKEVESLDEIPNYFYANSIAILFPYVRAFISTLTLQANYQPIVLPTMNLSDLSALLKEHVTVKE